MLLRVVFLLITFLSVAGLYFSSGKDNKGLAVFSAWAIVSGLLSYCGFYQNTDSFPPRIIILLVPAALVVLYLYRAFQVEQLRLGWLIAIHVLRIPVELTLFELYKQGQVPILMTYSGWNFDILSGISSVVILAMYLKGRLSVPILIIWNTLALLLLITIVGIALLSAPTPLQQFAFDQPNIAPLHFPFTFLPGVVVPIVLLSHLLLFKATLKQGKYSEGMLYFGFSNCIRCFAKPVQLGTFVLH